MLFYALVLLKANTTVLLLLGVPFFSHSEEESGSWKTGNRVRWNRESRLDL